MKAVFVGTLANGFALVAALEDAESAVKSLLNKAIYAEAIEVQAPESLDVNYQAKEGKFFTVFANGIGGEGVSVFGPFDNFDDAESFGIDNLRGDTSEVFDVNPEYLEELIDNSNKPHASKIFLVAFEGGNGGPMPMQKISLP